jgi:beta-mannosidase
LLKTLDPQTDYVPSSPVGGELGTISITSGEHNIGDTHYYLTNDSQAPYEKIRNMDFRFFSEFGFESFPSVKTIKSFTLPEDMAPFSDVILAHQKRRNGNQWIEEYMSRDYKVPANFEKYVYASQMIAGEIVKYVTEHLRRNEGKSMGMLTWQLNDSGRVSPGRDWIISADGKRCNTI